MHESLQGRQGGPQPQPATQSHQRRPYSAGQQVPAYAHNAVRQPAAQGAAAQSSEQASPWLGQQQQQHRQQQILPRTVAARGALPQLPLPPLPRRPGSTPAAQRQPAPRPALSGIAERPATRQAHAGATALAEAVPVITEDRQTGTAPSQVTSTTCVWQQVWRD